MPFEMAKILSETSYRFLTKVATKEYMENVLKKMNSDASLVI
jgi:hypothetical protein